MPLRPILLISAIAVTGCASGARPFPNAEPLTVDQDRQPFSPRPAKYFSPFAWDAIDNSVFRPVANFFAVDPAARAVNVTARDEVADSSWWENRIGLHPERITPEVLAVGPCEGAPPLDPAGPWTVVGGKPDGENPGFFIKGQDGSRYLLKFDGAAQAPRATAADVIGTRIYWAAGFHTPCNRIVFFDKAILTLDPEAMAERSNGRKEKMTQAMVDAAFKRAMQLEDGRYRANASLFLSGRPLGPWRYEGTRDDDPNDVVPHEDRRELRGASVLASWLNHFDSREQNTLDMWREVDGERGYIQHHYIDFGDCFGSLWEWDALSRRWGHAYLFDVGHIVGDWFSFGLIERPWDVASFGKSGDVYGYYDVAPFSPEDWVNEYPNPAFSRRQEDDAHWMTRIIAHFTDEHIERVVETAHLDEHDPILAPELTRILKGRRDVILGTWLERRSPLAHPELVPSASRRGLCFEDLAITRGFANPATRTYRGRALMGLERRRVALAVGHAVPGEVCVDLPGSDDASGRHPSYLVVEIASQRQPDEAWVALRAHLYQIGARDYRLVGIERPAPPKRQRRSEHE